MKNFFRNPTKVAYSLSPNGEHLAFNEGHGFANEENRLKFYRAMEEFLGKHLGGRVEKTSDTSKN